MSLARLKLLWWWEVEMLAGVAERKLRFNRSLEYHSRLVSTKPNRSQAILAIFLDIHSYWEFQIQVLRQYNHSNKV
jgi:hypothetical protein